MQNLANSQETTPSHPGVYASRERRLGFKITVASQLKWTFVPTATPATRDGLFLQFLQHPLSFLQSPAGAANVPQTPICSTRGSRDGGSGGGSGGDLMQTFSMSSSYDDKRPTSTSTLSSSNVLHRLSPLPPLPRASSRREMGWGQRHARRCRPRCWH